MHKQKNDLIFVLLLSALILTVPLLWLLVKGNWQSISYEEGRVLAVFPTLRVGSVGTLAEATTMAKEYAARTFQTEFEAASTDQFPFRQSILKFVFSLERGIIEGCYQLLAKSALRPASLRSHNLVLPDRSLIVHPPQSYNALEEENIRLRIKYFMDVMQKYPDIHLYAFYLDSIEISPYHPANAYFPEADQGKSLAYFRKNLPAGLSFGELPIDSFNTYRENFFLTDHHWSAQGAWKGYVGIYKLLSASYPEIGPMLTPKFVSLDNVNYYGSLTRIDLFPLPPDPFKVVIADLPPFETEVNGQKAFYGHKAEYLHGETSSLNYTNHYGEFYGYDNRLVTYHFANNKSRNLLIIGSSYSNAIDVFIASHFHDTYALDLRRQPLPDEPGTIGEWIVRYHVTDILFYDVYEYFFAPNWVITP